MPSRALAQWLTTRRRALDEVAAAHQAVGGSGPGRRRATEQINHAYAVLVSSQFQGFCRDLHTEAARAFVLILPQQAQSLVLARLVENRHLDRGNPNPGNLGSDFVRFGVELWPEVSARDSRNASRQKALGFLVVWRNAIAHQDFSSAALTPSRLRLATLAPLAFGMQRSRARVRHRTRGVPDEPGPGQRRGDTMRRVMATAKKTSHVSPKVGSTVRFRFGLKDVKAKVIEDRGPLGQGGERIYRVRFQFAGTSAPTETEVEAGRLKVVRGPE